jgi:glycosyltransferase involved in cell wall biosynthesis
MVCGSYWIAKSGLSKPFVKGRRIGFVDGIKVIELEMNYSNSDSYLYRTYIFLKYSLAGIRIALREDYDLLFATSTPLTAGIPGIIINFFKNKPFIFEVRDLWPELPKAMGVITNPVVLKLMDILETISYRSATSCVALSPGILKGIQNKVPDKEIIMIPNGCDLNYIHEEKKNDKHKKFVAVFTGAHGLANGLESVLDTAQILMHMGNRNIEIQFIGDGGLKKDLEERSRVQKLDNCFFLDPMPKKNLFNYLYKNADIGLMILKNIPAFYFGTSPNKFFDYISIGLPVINNYPGWISEIIKENNCGVAIPPNDSELFAKTLIHLSKNQNKINLMGDNAKRLAQNKFDRQKLGKKFVSFIESKEIKINV